MTVHSGDIGNTFGPNGFSIWLVTFMTYDFGLLARRDVPARTDRGWSRSFLRAAILQKKQVMVEEIRERVAAAQDRC